MTVRGGLRAFVVGANRRLIVVLVSQAGGAVKSSPSRLDCQPSVVALLTATLPAWSSARTRTCRRAPLGNAAPSGGKGCQGPSAHVEPARTPVMYWSEAGEPASATTAPWTWMGV